MAATDDDWRLTGQEDLVAGVVLVRRKYRRYANPAWDHDHCFFCNTKFSLEDGPGLLHDGYSTEDEYRWICTTCFEDFKDRFHWTVRAEETG